MAHHNVLQQILDLQEQFRAKYDNKFSDIFKRTISDIQKTSKTFSLLVTGLDISNEKENRKNGEKRKSK